MFGFGSAKPVSEKILWSIIFPLACNLTEIEDANGTVAAFEALPKRLDVYCKKNNIKLTKEDSNMVSITVQSLIGAEMIAKMANDVKESGILKFSDLDIQTAKHILQKKVELFMSLKK